MEQTTLFQILGDETRLRAVALMAEAGEVCVCELVHALELPQPKISRHMAAMRDAGLVVPRRDAQWVFYDLNPALPDWQQDVIAAAVEGIRTETVVIKDRKRLKSMNDRPVRCAVA